MAESGGLENRCALTGTVGSNPTLSVSDLFFMEFLWRGRLIGMAPRWKRGGPKGLCGFESRSLRFINLSRDQALARSGAGSSLG